MPIDETILRLYEIGAVKFGSYTLKSGMVSPIYIDLRESISYPLLLKTIAEEMWVKAKHLPCDRLCGVPYTALPIASYLSIAYNKPMVMRRKEIKEYGTKKAIEGVFTPGQTCLILEDLITSGLSIFETIHPLEAAGMQVKDVIVFLDREQGGRVKLAEKGYHLHPVITISEMLAVLHSHQKIDQLTVETVTNWRMSHA